MKTGGNNQLLLVVAVTLMKREAKVQDSVNMVLVWLELHTDLFRPLSKDAFQKRNVFMNLHGLSGC
jgi:hypothetical protein